MRTKIVMPTIMLLFLIIKDIVKENQTNKFYQISFI